MLGIAVNDLSLRADQLKFAISRLKPALYLDASRGVGTTGARSFAQARGELFYGSTVAGFGTADIAISGWIYPVSTPSSNSTFVLGCGGTAAAVPGASLRITQSSRLPMLVFATGVDGAYVNVSGGITPPLNVWSHVFAYVSRATKTVYIYVNGVLGNSITYTGQDSSFATAGPCTIGGLTGAATQYAFDGRLSKCGLFIGTLDHAAAAEHLYNQGNGRYWAEVTQADLIAAGKHYYNLNESQLSPAIDAIGNNDCAIMGANLLTNGGFETAGLSGWTPSAVAPSIVIDNTVNQRSGSRCCELQVGSANEYCAVQGAGALVSGRQYALSLYAKGSLAGTSIKHDSGTGSTVFSPNLTTSYQQYSNAFVATTTTLTLSRNALSSQSAYIDDVVLTSAQIDSAAGPREAMASDLVGGYHGVLTNMDAVSSWSTDTPDGSYTALKQDSVGSADGTMTGFTDIDAAHVDGPDGAWGPAVTDRGSSPAQGWLLSSVKDSRSASVPSSLNTRVFDEYYSEPASTGSRWLTRTTTYQKFALANAPAFGSNDFSLEFMMYPASSGAGEFPIGCGGYTAGNTGLSVYRTGAASYVQVNICDGVNPVVNVTSPMAASAYTWHHVVVTVNRATNTVSLWLNGALVATGSIALLSGPLTPSTIYKALGAVSTTDVSYSFDGALTGIRFYLGNVLSPAEIAESYNGGKGRAFSELSTALAAKVDHNWDLDGANGENEPDTVGGNTATAAGTGTISSAASPYLPAFDATLTGFTSSPRSSDVPTAFIGKCKSILGTAAGYAKSVKTVTGMGARSVAVAFKRNGNPSTIERIVAECSTTGTGFGLYLDTSGRLYAHVTAAGVQVAAKSTTATFCDNAWHTAVVTWDGTTNANAFTLTTDLESGTATATGASQGGASQYEFQISGYAGGANNVFQGYVCRPTVWAGRALTPAEVATWAAGGDVTEGLTAEWRFNEPDAITVPFEYSLKCDALTTQVDCGSGTLPVAAKTVSAWIYYGGSGESGYGRILDDGSFEFYEASSGVLGIRCNGSTVAMNASAALGAVGWYHVAATCDASGFGELFINGRLIPVTKSNTVNVGVPTAGSSNLFIANNAAQSRTWNGLIGQVRIDSGVLTQSQIRQLAMGQSPTTPTHDWRFDDQLDLPYLDGCKAIRFDGSDDAIACGDNLDAGLSDFTIMAWARTSDTTAVLFPTILGKYDTITTAGRYRIRLNSSTVTFNYQTTAGNFSTPASGVVTDGQWHHYAATADRDGNASLYVDGVLIGTVSIAAASAENHNTTAAFTIGDAGTTDGNWNGDIADARAFGSALTQSQIRQIIDGTDYLTGLTARWKFGETPRSIPSCAGGYSMTFDGTNDRIFIGDVLDTRLSDMTLSIWAKLQENAADQWLLHKSDGTATDGRFGIRVVASTGISSGFFDTGSTVAVTGAVKVTDGAWHHLALVFDRDGSLTQYVDGVADGTPQSIAAAVATDFNTAIEFAISGTNVPAYVAKGRLDDARVYMSALSASDIALLAAGGEPTTNPTAHWTMDDGPQYGEPSNGDPITVWESKEGINFVQSNQSYCPTYLQSGANGRPGLTFDGLAQYLEVVGWLPNDPYGTIVAVVKQNASQTAKILSSADKGTATTYFTSVGLSSSGAMTFEQKNNDTADDVRTAQTVGTSNARVLSYRSDGATYTARIDGTAYALTASAGANSGDWMADTANRDSVTIGTMLTSSAYAYLNGTIYELLYFPRPLSDVELRKVERILGAKYGVTVA